MLEGGGRYRSARCRTDAIGPREEVVVNQYPEARPVALAPEVLVQRLMDDETVFLNLDTEE